MSVNDPKRTRAVLWAKMSESGIFIADNVLAKHDENYMPPEVAEALKAADQWQGDEGEE